MSDIEQTMKNALNSIAIMRESTIGLILTVIILLFIAFAIILYFYYSRKKNSNSELMKDKYGTLNGQLKSIDSSFIEPIKNYYIKSAYNACSGGNYKNDYVDISVLKDLLKQGVRGLDFQIFSIDDQPVVATSINDSFYIKETFNYIPFSEVMSIIRDYAFAMSTAPNPNDPILIHLRINSSNQTMYKNFAKIFEKYSNLLLGKEYSYENRGKNFGDVKLNDIMGKVVIIVDRSNISFLESHEFYEYVNMTSNSVFMRALRFYDIKYTPDMNELTDYNKQNMTIGMPDKNADPENPSSIIMREMGCQLLAMRYQKIDANLEENNDFFNKNGYAFVLKPKKLQNTVTTIPIPPAQNPDLSYATRTIQTDYYKFNI